MGLLDWFKRRGSTREEEAVEREELGIRGDAGEADLERFKGGAPEFAADEAARAAEADLSEFEPPRNP
jgi:hypothetical protein